MQCDAAFSGILDVGRLDCCGSGEVLPFVLVLTDRRALLVALLVTIDIVGLGSITYAYNAATAFDDLDSFALFTLFVVPPLYDTSARFLLFRARLASRRFIPSCTIKETVIPRSISSVYAYHIYEDNHLKAARFGSRRSEIRLKFCDNAARTSPTPV